MACCECFTVDVEPKIAKWQSRRTREELEYRAFKVEQQADKELRNLMQVLDLDEDRQDRVFAALARRSEYFHPDLQPQSAAGGMIGPVSSRSGPSAPGAAPAGTEGRGDAGTPSESQPSTGPTTATDPVFAELTPQEADVYARYTSEREAFWAGVVEDIEREINTAP